MLSLFNPTVWLGLALAFGLTFWAGHHKGYAQSEMEQAVAIAQANDEARAVERTMTTKLNETTAKLRKENDAAKTQITFLRLDVASGNLRLSIPAKTSVCASSDTAITSGNNEARTELDAKTADALISITADGDEAIRKLNACIDSYNQVRIR